MKDGDVSGDAAAAVNEEEEDTFVDEEPETLIVDGTWQSNKSLNDDGTCNRFFFSLVCG